MDFLGQDEASQATANGDCENGSNGADADNAADDEADGADGSHVGGE